MQASQHRGCSLRLGIEMRKTCVQAARLGEHDFSVLYRLVAARLHILDATIERSAKRHVRRRFHTNPDFLQRWVAKWSSNIDARSTSCPSIEA